MREPKCALGWGRPAGDTSGQETERGRQASLTSRAAAGGGKKAVWTPPPLRGSPPPAVARRVSAPRIAPREVDAAFIFGLLRGVLKYKFGDSLELFKVVTIPLDRSWPRDLTGSPTPN
jgi:hypothetical protein